VLPCVCHRQMERIAQGELDEIHQLPARIWHQPAMHCPRWSDLALRVLVCSCPAARRRKADATCFEAGSDPPTFVPYTEAAEVAQRASRSGEKRWVEGENLAPRFPQRDFCDRRDGQPPPCAEPRDEGCIPQTPWAFRSSNVMSKAPIQSSAVRHCRVKTESRPEAMPLRKWPVSRMTILRENDVQLRGSRLFDGLLGRNGNRSAPPIP